MKPVYLEMNAFGPYAGRQVVDFRLLGERKLFLIYGPTGAGKTTVLDAMCFALYGETSGNVRAGAHMRSEYASPDEETYVIFSFAIGGRLYCAERRPEQRIAKKRGGGTKISPMSAKLYELKDGGASKVVIAAKNVREAVERILGFKAEQFRQVVLLPQGDFRRLLLANSADRQQIMQTLFHTHRYALLQELAKQKHDAVQEEYKALGGRIDQRLQQLGAPSAEALEEMRKQLAEEKGRQEAERAAAAADRDAYQETVQQAQVLHSHWQSLKESRAQAEALSRQRQVFEEKRAYIKRMQQAQLFVEPFRNLDDVRKQGERKRTEADEAARLADANRRRLQQAKEKTAELSRQEQGMKEKREQLVRLQSMAGKAEAYRDICRQLEQKAAETISAQHEAEAVRQRREALQGQTDSLRRQLEAQQSLAAAAEQVKGRLALAEEREKRERSIEQLAEDMEAARKACRQAEECLKKADMRARRDQLDYDGVQALFLQGQAALLAEELQDGEPCPVCGSTTHPQAAVLPADMPSKSDVDQRKEQAESSKDARQRAEVALRRAETEYQERQRRYDDLRRHYPFEQTSRQWQHQIAVLREEAESCRRTAGLAEKTRKDLDAREQEQTAAAAKEEQARSRAEQCRLEEVRLRTAKEQAEADVPPEYRQAGELRRHMDRLQKAIQAYDEAAEQCRKELVDAERESAACSSRENTAQQEVKDLREQYVRQRDELKARIGRAGFSSLAECQAVQQDLPSLGEQEQALNEYDKAVHQLQGRISQEEAYIGGRPEPVMDEYRRTLDEKNRRCRDLSERSAASALRLEELTKAEGDIRSWQDQQAGLTEQYKSIGAIYELLSGQQTGVNFERYVLGALLDEVLGAANVRLDQMSRHRYELQRSRSWDDKRVRRIGLDIEVFDNYTGYARPANTLSGGETFLASLSLALGLADVVQAYSGGIHLDTIFIDEGFGTLDGETLDFALKTLIGLKQDGRLVGIISHVAELKERIDARLAVTKTDRGSKASFELA